jgi:hypothetical protein
MAHISGVMLFNDEKLEDGGSYISIDSASGSFMLHFLNVKTRANFLRQMNAIIEKEMQPITNPITAEEKAAILEGTQSS